MEIHIMFTEHYNLISERKRRKHEVRGVASVLNTDYPSPVFVSSLSYHPSTTLLPTYQD